MTSESFLENFGHFADAPNGILKLRELILELAVRGRLVEQNSNDEPASMLLESIKAKRKELIRSKQLRNTKEPLRYDQEGEIVLPDSWCYTTLFEIGDIGPRNSIDDDTDVSFVPMSLISEKYDIPVQSETREWGEVKSGYTHFAEGDVCLAKITPCFQNGKSAVMRNLVNEVGAGTTELHVFRPIDSRTCPEYIRLFLKSPLFISEGIPRMTGSAGQKRVPRDYFAGKPFPLPPYEEQQRIVSKVDQLMALCDELEEKQAKQREGRINLNNSALDALLNVHDTDELVEHWQRICDNFDLLYDHPETIRKLRGSILRLAFMGRLVPQVSDNEPTPVLLKRISGEKESLVKDGAIKKTKSPITAGDDLSLHLLPPNWEWVTGQEIFHFITSGSRGWAKYYSKEGSIFLRIGNLDYESISLDLTNIQRVCPPKGAEGTRTRVQARDILISITGDTGMVTIVPNDFEEAYINQHIALARPSTLISAEYIARFLTSPVAIMQFQNAQRGIKNSLSLDDIRGVLIPIPPFNEQKRIVAIVDQLMALCDQLEQQLNQAQYKAAKYAESAAAAMTAA